MNGDHSRTPGRCRETRFPAGCILRQEPFPVLVDDVVDHFVGDLRKIGPSDNVVHFVLTGDHLGRSGRREIGTENEFMFHAVFHGSHERLVMPQWTVVQSRNIRIQVRVLADQHDTFGFPGVSHVGDDDPQVRARQSDILQLNRICVFERRKKRDAEKESGERKLRKKVEKGSRERK